MTTEIDAEGLAWPERLTLRDTKVYADEGQRIFTTATGHGYARQEYVRADLATTRTSEAEPVANTIDREALRKRIENDPDEGEIGAGFEMFTPEAEVALERMAFAALPRWAQDELTALRAAATLPTPASDDHLEADYFGSLVERARAAAAKASVKFPQPNYVTLKIAEEAGEVVRGAVHYAENRMEWSEVEGEIVQLLAMLIRFVTEGDQINGVTPPAALAAMGSTKR